MGAGPQVFVVRSVAGLMSRLVGSLSSCEQRAMKPFVLLSKDASDFGTSALLHEALNLAAPAGLHGGIGGNGDLVCDHCVLRVLMHG